jgi:polyhydroxybutyrate depolymerase
MNGTDDPLVPYEGGQVGKRRSQRGEVLSTQASIDYWVRHDGADPNPHTQVLTDRDRRDGGRVYVHRYRNGEESHEVMLYEVRGGGHTEPSLSEHYSRLWLLLVGPQNRDIEMAEEVWAFFKNKRRK